MTRCTLCGAELSPRDSICPDCGRFITMPHKTGSTIELKYEAREETPAEAEAKMIAQYPEFAAILAREKQKQAEGALPQLKDELRKAVNAVVIHRN